MQLVGGRYGSDFHANAFNHTDMRISSSIHTPPPTTHENNKNEDSQYLLNAYYTPGSVLKNSHAFTLAVTILLI